MQHEPTEAEALFPTSPESCAERRIQFTAEGRSWINVVHAFAEDDRWKAEMRP